MIRGNKTYINAFTRHMFIILPGIRSLGAFLPNDSKLLRIQDGLPFIVALLDRIIRHIFCGRSEERAQKGNAGHRTVDGSVAEDEGLDLLGEARGGGGCQACGQVCQCEGAYEGLEGGWAHWRELYFLRNLDVLVMGQQVDGSGKRADDIGRHPVPIWPGMACGDADSSSLQILTLFVPHPVTSLGTVKFYSHQAVR